MPDRSRGVVHLEDTDGFRAWLKTKGLDWSRMDDQRREWVVCDFLRETLPPPFHTPLA